MAAISGANDVMQSLGIDDPRAVQAMGVVARQSKHLSRMVDDLIDLTRISHAKLKLQKERVELGAALDQAVNTIRPQIESRQHRLSIDIPATPITLDADPVRLSQMLANLLDNAAKFTPNGGEISITAELTDDQVLISVRDTGFGIPKNQIDNIFDLFMQLDTSQTTASRGLGMGLSLVRNLAQLHGGSVEVVSAGPGQGSVFTLRLPIFPDSSLPTSSSRDETKSPIEKSVGSFGVHRVLLVDDDDDVAQSMGALLALDGHTVSIANDAKLALETLRTFAPDVVFLDLGLPRIDGYQVARRMRSATMKEDLVIIAVSGYGEEEHRRRSKEAGCDGHLVKPVQPEVLRSLLRRIRNSSTQL